MDARHMSQRPYRPIHLLRPGNEPAHKDSDLVIKQINDEIRRLARSAATVSGFSMTARTKTGNYTVASDDSVILVNARSAGVTSTRRAAAAAGRVLNVKKIDTSANTVLLQPVLSQTID